MALRYSVSLEEVHDVVDGLEVFRNELFVLDLDAVGGLQLFDALEHPGRIHHATLDPGLIRIDPGVGPAHDEVFLDERHYLIQNIWHLNLSKVYS